MEGDGGVFQDWELLHHNNLEGSDSVLVNSAESKETTIADDDFGDGVEGMIQANYFSLDAQKGYSRIPSAPISEAGSEASDNPSWIDPGLETRYPRKISGEFWSDSGSDRSDDRKFGEFEGKPEVGFIQSEKQQGDFEGVGEFEAENDKVLDKCLSDSVGIESAEIKAGDFEENSDVGVREDVEPIGGSEVLAQETRENESLEGDTESQSVVTDARRVGERKSAVWWKLPMEFFRYCVVRVSPGWALSVAAAVVGFVILGRRLYKMKKKSRGLELKVTMDDKKISQFMSRAARLNEAFSVVKRVPVIRPSLPAVGVTPWPVVSLR